MDFQSRTCAVAGQGQIPTDKITATKEDIHRKIVEAIQRGYRFFILGITGPSCVHYGDAILSAIGGRDGISLEVYMPYPGWVKDYAAEHEKAISEFLKKTHGTDYANPAPIMDTELLLHNGLLDRSGRVLVVYDGTDERCASLVQSAKDSDTPVDVMLIC